MTSVTQLTPTMAATAAVLAYQMQKLDRPSPADVPGFGSLAYGFDLDSVTRFTGDTGALFFRLHSGFGFVAGGRAGSDYDGHVLVATRGTDAGTDWLSNLNMALDIGPSGHLSHAGFNRTHKSTMGLIDDAVGQIKKKTAVKAVHFVGHSLGGAVATLNATWAITEKYPNVHCYTFGAPRVGGMVFASWLGEKLNDRLHRVHHTGDPVPLVPLFPFMHAPLSGVDHAIGGDWLLALGYHSMPDTYYPNVARVSDWNNFGANARAANEDSLIRNWLEQAGLSGGWLMGSSKLLNYIGRALRFIFDAALVYLGATVGTELVLKMTAIDKIAAILKFGFEKSIEIAGYVITLIRAIGAFLGRQLLSAGQAITTAFLRWILDLLFTAVANLARGALSKLI